MSNPFASPAADPPPSASAAGYSWRPNRLRARVLMVALALSALLDGLAVLTTFGNIAFPIEESGLGLFIGVIAGFVGLGQMFVFLATAITWVLWQHRASANTFAAGAESEFTPGWSVGYWFIPFLNLVRPYQAISAIWAASAAQTRSAEGPAAIVGVWWGAWLVSNFASNLAMRVFGLEISFEADLAWSFANLASLVAGLLAILVVRGVDEVQATLAAERGFAH